MTTPLHRLFKVRQHEDTGHTIVTASTPDVDRYGDIVEAPWRLEHFRANPVIPWGHDYSVPPVGRAVDVEIRDGQLEATIEWDSGDHNPLGTLVAAQFAKGMLSTVSVGFYPGESVQRASLQKDDPRHGQRGMVHRDNELLEISAVTIPANPKALAQRGLEQVSETALIQRWTEQGFRAQLKDDLMDLLRTDAQVRALLEALHLSSAAPSPVDFWKS